METINHEYYVSLEVAKLLKEAGFDWNLDVNFVYADIDKEIQFLSYIYVINNYIAPNIKPYGGPIDRKKYKCCYLAPTLEIAQRWLRVVHHLHITIFSSSQESWMFRITKPHQKLEDGVYGEDFYTFEEAQEAGIKKALEIILECK